MRKTLWLFLALACATAALAAPLPVPLVTETNAAPDALEKLNQAEVSAGFFVRFDKLPAEGTVCGLFRIAADKEGRVELTIPADPDDLVGDMKYTSQKTVGKKSWHHVAFAYSRQQRRVAVWLDGDLQYENNTQWIPAVLGFGKPDPAANGSGAVKVKALRVYDISLTSDYLRPADHFQRDLAKAKSLAEKASASQNSHLAEWGRALAANADALLATNPEEVSERAVFELLRDAGNAAKISGDIAAMKHPARMGGAVAAYTVDPVSQEMFLPYHYPQDGELSGSVLVAAAPGQEQAASILVFPFRPLQKFIVRVGDLTGPGGAKFPATAIDIKLVKRVYMTGGAWSSYHRDPRLRILTPCLLVNDDDLFHVDELKCRNYARLNYPEGVRYADISDPDAPVQRIYRSTPLRDAETLQPVNFGETGRNQQYLLTFRVPKGTKPGLYKGVVQMTSRGAGVGSELAVQLRVLPIELPDAPRSYDNLEQRYISLVNSFGLPPTISHADRVKAVREHLENVHAHNANHYSGIWSCGEEVARMALDVGFVPDYLFRAFLHISDLPDWRSYYKDIASTNLTMKEKVEGKRLVKRAYRGRDTFLKRIAPGATPVGLFLSESGSYYRIADEQRERAEVAHELGYEIIANGSGANLEFGSDIQDMNSDAGNPSRERAERWHAAGGAVIGYCYPFPSSENPQMHRRWNGFERYKEHRYDGSMQHGFTTSHYDEFRDDPGGDGNYRNFCVAYLRQNGLIYTLAWEGWREAYTDILYATKLKQLCEPRLHDPDLAIRGEAKRALGWLDRQNGVSTDLNMLRAGLIHRILTMQKLIDGAKEAE